MKDATKFGIAQKCKMDIREETTQDEEAILWGKGLLGGFSAESLMYESFIFITEKFLVFELTNTGYLGSAIFLLKKITLFSMKVCLRRFMVA